MAYRKQKRQYRKGPRRRRGGRRNYNNSNFTYGNVLDKVVNDVYRLKGLINVEFKTNDLAASATLTTTPLIAVLNSISTGDQFNTRDGRKVRWKSVQVNLEITMHATPINDMVRIMIVIDKQPNEIGLVIGDLLDTTTICSFRNLDQRKRFVILRDDVITLSVGGGTVKYWNYYRKIDMITIYDDSDAGTIADISTNAMWLVMFSTEATNGPTVSRCTRMRFIDN